MGTKLIQHHLSGEGPQTNNPPLSLIEFSITLFQDIEDEGARPNSFYNTSITKPNESTLRKEIYRLVSLQIQTENLNKILSN